MLIWILAKKIQKSYKKRFRKLLVRYIIGLQKTLLPEYVLSS